MNIEIDEGQRQMIVLALAELALSRPGWDWTLGETAKRFDGEAMFAEFKRLNADRVKAERAPLGFPLIAQTDDPLMLEWLGNAKARAGAFVRSVAEAGLHADYDNYPLIRPFLMEMRLKYREYEPEVNR